MNELEKMIYAAAYALALTKKDAIFAIEDAVCAVALHRQGLPALKPSSFRSEGAPIVQAVINLSRAFNADPL